MRLTEYLHRLLVERLNEYRIVAWYDGEQAFGDFVRQFKAPLCRVVSAEASTLVARREADLVYRQMEESAQPAQANANLLIYIPHARAIQDQRPLDPFEVFVQAGTVFGEAESEHLQSLARAAMPELIDQIDGLYLSSQPDFALLDQLKLTSAYPLVEQALGTQSVVEACVALLGLSEAVNKVDKTHGARAELLRLLEVELGCVLSAKTKSLKTLREHLGHYILLSELAFDLSGSWPDSLTNVSRAEFKHRDRIYAICERLRTSDDTREAYIELANRVERELKLPDHFIGVTQLGERDTFGFEEKQYLAILSAAVQADDIAQARAILDGRYKSVWRHQPERTQVWQLAERCISLLDTARTASVTDSPGSLSGLVTAYTSKKAGWSDLDRQQRLMEQSYADCAECEVPEVVDLARRRYRESIQRIQERFLQQVQAQGWPPDGFVRQTQVFDRFVAPALERRQKVVYILADSLRFEMGRALADELEPFGEVTLQAAAAFLPTTTTIGMAALMPGADGALALRAIGSTYVPHIGERALPDSNARMALLKEKYGDRFADVTLNDWLDFADKKRAALARQADLLIVRVPDIDELGEHVSLRQARKYMSDLLGDLKVAIVQLTRLEFGVIVIAADHGHVLLPEVLPGDTITVPEGDWGLSRRRSKLGKQVNERAGSLIFKPSHLGIQTDASDYCVPTGFAVYAADANYFHEGLSLQECIIPVIELHPKSRPETVGKQQQIEIRYPRGDKFTSQVIGLKVYYTSIFDEPLRIRLEAYDSSNLKGPSVGDAADCTARDENTHEVTLQRGIETEVPLLINPDFTSASVEIRAMSPDRSVVWARLKLKNGILD